MTDIAAPRRGMAKGTILITKERKRIAEHAERTSNAPFTARDARKIVGLTTPASARDMIDRLIKLGWAEKTERPKYSRIALGDPCFRMTRSGIEAILGAERADVLFDCAVAPEPATLTYKAVGRPHAAMNALEIMGSEGLVRIPLSDVRKVYETLHALIGRRSEG